jgi:hypothetical protein
MSAVTLETLRADFERHAHVEFDLGAGVLRWLRLKYISKKARRDDLLTRCLVQPEPLYRLGKAGPYNQLSPELILAANIYKLALDHGLQAAMLFKLSGGNMDPRVSA